MGQIIFVTSTYQKLEPKYGFQTKITSPYKIKSFGSNFFFTKLLVTKLIVLFWNQRKITNFLFSEFFSFLDPKISGQLRQSASPWKLLMQ
jgi:hypothetical protein